MPSLHFPDRLARLQGVLSRKRIDALLVTQPANRRYLSGYNAEDHGIQESAGVLLVPRRGQPFLLTDSRFLLQAEEEATGFAVRLYQQGLMATLSRLLPELRVRRLGFESHYLLHATAGRLARVTDKLKVELVPGTDFVEPLRIVKNNDEIAKLRAAVLLNEQVFQKVYRTIRPGMTESAIALDLETAMREMGAAGPSFPTIVAFGTNAAKPHAIPGSRVLAAGETVLIDMGLVLDGYCADMTRTVMVGEPAPLFRERLRIVRRAQLAAIQTIRAGVTCRQVDLAARRVIREAGYGACFGHALGHGVGLEVHEEPRLSSRSRKKLRAGMVVTVEPGIYLPDWGGIRLENMVVVREEGCEVLNRDTTFLDR
ncbi:MAG: aminopeptidase P family protein [Desulfobulbus sp.]|nr:MAG: aminopeptidase P family protein [Desulfobulbus sp.]